MRLNGSDALSQQSTSLSMKHGIFLSYLPVGKRADKLSGIKFNKREKSFTCKSKLGAPGRLSFISCRTPSECRINKICLAKVSFYDFLFCANGTYHRCLNHTYLRNNMSSGDSMKPFFGMYFVLIV